MRTNYDRIKSFTLEQMWKFLIYYAEGDIDTAMGFCDLCVNDAKERGTSTDCDGCIKHWLKNDEQAPQGLGYDIYRPWNLMMDEVPAPQPMSAVEYLRQERRMCEHYGLPTANLTPEEAVVMIQKFMRDYPEGGKNE